MPNYFDYILESSQEDIDDVDNVYNEYDMMINEFDTYVQEGVGVKILLGIGLAALIGLVITAIIKLVSNTSGSSAAVAVAQAKHMSKLAEKYGVEQVEFDAKHKKGWMTNQNMSAFQVILHTSNANKNAIEDLIKYLEDFDEKDIESVDLGSELKKIWNDNVELLTRTSSGSLMRTGGKTLDDFNVFQRRSDNRSIPESMSGKDPDEWGETGIKTITQINDRLIDLGLFIKDFKDIGKALQGLQTRAKTLEQNKPTLMGKRAASLEQNKSTLMDNGIGVIGERIITEVIGYVNEANRIMTESANAIKDAIKIQISENKGE